MSELKYVEKPAIRALVSMGYEPMTPAQLNKLRDGKSDVLLREHLIEAVMRINDVPRETAASVYGSLLKLNGSRGVEDNEKWFERLRGNYSKKVAGEATHTTIRLLDFDNPKNNKWVVTWQFRVKGKGGNPKPDVVVFCNGIPLVVLEAKATTVGIDEGIDQIERYQRWSPKLFASNIFNISTNSRQFRYAATGSPRAYWFRWREVYAPSFGPEKPESFEDPMHQGLWATLEPSRLLDIIAHFVVFERDEKSKRIVKKVCRYQQYRAVNKMVERVCAGKHRQGLIWHTQGSGKSLTMAFATLKLKFHRGLDHPALENPNIMVLTDRRDLDDQITNTFRACGLPNPKHAESIRDLRELLAQDSPGRTITSTIFKFDQDDWRLQSGSMREREKAVAELAIDDSDRWILLIDECHRTQEELLGAYLRAMLPDAFYFGFTGTPVKKNDKDTYNNFGAAGELYLDKYGIDEAVIDEATVEVRYTARMSQWHLEEVELDETFDRWFAAEPEETVEKIKERGVRKTDLARLDTRIHQLAKDMWDHYRQKVMPDGYKAQVVAIDRQAVAVYKQALDDVIANWFMDEHGLDEAAAEAQAKKMSAAVYSPAQNDTSKPELADVVRYQLTASEQKEAISAFNDEDDPLCFLVVCDKLLTGFDAPIEQVMYIDKPLADHNLLQAIARTNRRYKKKPYGLIVDYYGVTKNLKEALSAYRNEDVGNAMTDEANLHAELADAHREVMAMIDDEYRHSPYAAAKALGGEDQWYLFRGRAKEFLDLYAALMPDPEVIKYAADVKFLGAMMPCGKQKWEQDEADLDFKEYSEKIREMLRRHVEVTGITQICRLRSLKDPMFWDDFDADPEDLETAAVRKLTELKKVVREKTQQNEQRYEKFSERVREIIESFQLMLPGLEKDGREALSKQTLDKLEEVARDLEEEEQAHQGTTLNEEAYGIYRILEESIEVYAEALVEETAAAVDVAKIEALAEEIDELYRSDKHAPSRWQEKTEVRRKLRSNVRKRLIKAGVSEWKGIPEKIEKFARGHYAKV